MIHGKVRDIVDEGKTLLLISTNRLSAFDRAICEIPCKGVVLNQLSAWWFERTRSIIQNHLIDMPEANIMRVRKCEVLPIEIIVRAYITGSTNTSLWTLYQQGARSVFGAELPAGLVKNQALPQAILTPTTKSKDHDHPLERADLANIPHLTPALWQKIETTALALFQFASDHAAKQGLIIADTKYEFGLDENHELCLIDEIHTPDSSRYWDQAEWEEALREKREPASYDKEIIRLWYRQHCDPYQTEKLPVAPVQLIQEVSERYKILYNKITGNPIICAES